MCNLPALVDGQGVWMVGVTAIVGHRSLSKRIAQFVRLVQGSRWKFEMKQLEMNQVKDNTFFSKSEHTQKQKTRFP